MKFNLQISAASLMLVCASRAWYIDTSCNPNQAAFVTEAITSAFEMSNLADAKLTNINTDIPVRDLMRSLYGPDDTWSAAAIHRVFGPDGFQRMQTRHTSPDQLTKWDFRIYCDQKRLKLRVKDPGHYYDPDLQQTVKITAKIDCVKTAAYTQRPTKKDKTDPDRYDQIQLCPWFLDYAMSKDFRFKKSITPSIWGALAVRAGNWLSNTWYTPIDLLSLFDKLTHTLSGTETDDVGGKGGYGWKNCRALSTVITSDATGKYGPEKNADSFALFATGCYYIGQGFTINDDGSVNHPRKFRRRAMEPPARASIAWQA